ncbi:MAG: rhamnan synthesis F family protein, partial [Eubacteriales bacterium]
LDDLIVVAPKLDENAKAFLSPLTSRIVASKEAMRLSAYHTGFKLAKDRDDYDEICFFDSSLLGPFYPPQDMFSIMQSCDCDFWSLHKVDAHPAEPSEQKKYGLRKNAKVPEHLVWSLMLIKRNVFTSLAFKKVFAHTKKPNDEVLATQALKAAGFTFDVFLKTDDLTGYTNHVMMDAPLIAVRDKKTPFIDENLFSRDLGEALETSLGQTVRPAFDYIDQHTPYDVNLIWDRILRTANQHDIKNALGLSYVLPADHDLPKKANAEALSVALCMHLYYEDLFDYCLNYAEAMPSRTHVIITTNSSEKKTKIEKVFSVLSCASLDVRVIGNRGRDVSSLLIGCRDAVEKYDIICYMHDKKTTQWSPASVGDAFSYQCFENNLASSYFVGNVLQTFADHPRLGILSPTPPFHASIYQTLGREWILNFDNTVKLAQSHGITVPIEDDKPPLAPLGTMFWFRGKALAGLCKDDLTYDDFPPEPNNLNGTVLHAYERLYPYAAQSAGYYPGHLLSQEYGVLQLNAHYHMLLGLNRRILDKVGLKHEKYTQVIHTLDKHLPLLTAEKRYEVFVSKIPPKLKRVLGNIKRAVFKK